MINTIKKILEFDISDDKKIELIRALLKESLTTTSGLAWTPPNGVMPFNGIYPNTNGSSTIGHNA